MISQGSHLASIVSRVFTLSPDESPRRRVTRRFARADRNLATIRYVGKYSLLSANPDGSRQRIINGIDNQRERDSRSWMRWNLLEGAGDFTIR